MHKKTTFGLFTAVCITLAASGGQGGLTVSPGETLEMQGLTVLVHQQPFHPIFFDEKNAGIQIILHGERIATDGEVRLNPTPEQWDPVPAFLGRSRGPVPDQLIVRSAYKNVGLKYSLQVTAEGEGFRIAVNLDKPLPKTLAGKAGFNLDFLPTSYFGKTFLMDQAPGLFPRHPNGPMAKDGSGDPLPLASGGHSLTLAPEDGLTRVSITSEGAPLALYDARNRAQNGWFVVRSLIPEGARNNAIVWHVRPTVQKNWVRTPVISFNQAGYTPGRSKVALIELDPGFHAPDEATLVRLTGEGVQNVLTAKIRPWGHWTRYQYATFDFSSVRTPGVYAISYGGRQTNPFRIAADAYAHIWQPSLDTYLAVQMDHVAVREQYRVWNGIAHMDDARQAPPNHVHFDGYKMGAELDSPFRAGEHIPGLNIGGWQDAGDYDIQTPSNAAVVRDLVWARELFGLDWDETSIDEATRQVEIRKPDGQPDALQQIRHGTLQLLAQYKVFGHAIVGIVEPTLKQYTHLGDAGSQTDRLVYDPHLGLHETSGDRSGLPDDRWAFTTDEPSTDYFVVAALASAARALENFDPPLANEARQAAIALWQKQLKRPPYKGDWGRMDSDDPVKPAEIVRLSKAMAAVELVLTTRGDVTYTSVLKEMLPVIRQHFEWTGGAATRAIAYMDADYKAQLRASVIAAKPALDANLAQSPFGVPVSKATWAGSGQVAMFGANMYLLHKAFPDIIAKDYTLAALDYMLGRHPATNLSLVSTVGTASKLIGYGHNRADYSFIPGGMVPGVLVIKPDFPEQKVDWPFLWFENEYTVSTTSSYILAANAAIALAGEDNGEDAKK